jgi:hypothetical protein
VQTSRAVHSLDELERSFARIYPLIVASRTAVQFFSTIALAILVIVLCGAVYGLASLVSGMPADDLRSLSFWLVSGASFAGFLLLGSSYWLLLARIGRMSRLAAVLWLLLVALELYINLPVLWSSIKYVTQSHGDTMLPEAMRYARAASVVLLAACWLWVVLVTVARGGVAALLAAPDQRSTMAETTGKRRFPRAALAVFLGFPPLTEFARRSPGRYVRVVTLATLSGLPLACASGLAAAAPIFYSNAYVQAAAYFPDFWLAMIVLLLGLGGAFFVLMTVGREIERRELDLLRFSLDQLTAIDVRPPVLFLRAFADDHVHLPEPRLPLLARALEFGRRPVTLDDLLLEEGTPYGPVVALGNPDDERPPYGAARGYFAHQSWNQAVIDLVGISSLIVVCLDVTEGVLWEAGQIAASGQLHKTLFLVHPKHGTEDANRALLAKVMARIGLDSNWSDQLTALSTAGAAGSQRQVILGFYVGADGQPRFLLSSQFSRLTYLLAIRLFSRSVMAPVAGVP